MHLNQACAKFVSVYFSTNGRAMKTRAAYLSDLTQFNAFAGGDPLLKSLSGSLIERWCAHLRQKGYWPTSLRRKMVVLKVFCPYWVRGGSLRESPFWRVKLSYGRAEQLPRALSAREMRRLLSQARRNDSSAAAILNDGEAALFLNSSGNRLTTQDIANVIARLREEAGINRQVTPHMLRHTVATLLLRNGVDIRIVQEFLGHASIATTRRHTHVTKEHLKGVLRKRHPSLGMRTK